ncbi:ribosomal-processing cysteine protease Prp [Oceanobacillus massiliensis]|uniref:ribosomal-processing cysteine protease Prp n=1 Tax=Oceanobacillus massiliensis TaxID=1465765 RepID=UPI0002880D9F|nr:ribosomal-processing cysteine protease Prp [Oceanobacillus massiliensis]
MIQVTVFRTDNQITSFKLSGHADSGPYGYDLVCAGVSAVSIGTVNAVMELFKTDLEIEQGAEGGYLHVKLPDTLEPEIMEKAQLLFEGMIISLQSIELEYSEFIKIVNK